MVALLQSSKRNVEREWDEKDLFRISKGPYCDLIGSPLK